MTPPELLPPVEGVRKPKEKEVVKTTPLERIQKSLALHRTPQELDINELRNQRSVERRGKLESIVEQKLKLEGMLGEKIHSAPDGDRGEWMKLREDFQKEFADLSDQYIHSQDRAYQEDPDLRKFDGPGKVNGLLEVRDEATRNSLLQHFTVLVEGLTLQIEGKEKRLEKNEVEDTRRAVELSETTIQCLREFTQLSVLSGSLTTRDPIHAQVEASALRYLQAIKTEGSYLYRNLRGRILYPETSSHIDVDQRMEELLENQQHIMLYLSDKFPEKYRGTPATSDALRRYAKYLMDYPAQTDARTLEKAFTAQGEDLKFMSERTDAAETSNVSQCLGLTNKDTLMTEDPKDLTTYRTELRAYLSLIQKEGSYLFRHHRKDRQERIQSLKEKQTAVQTTLIAVEKALNPRERNERKTVEKLFADEIAHAPGSDWITKIMNREDQANLQRLQAGLQNAKTDTPEALSNALATLQEYQTLAQEAFPRRGKKEEDRVRRLQTIEHKLRRMLYEKKLNEEDQEYTSRYMKNHAYMNETKISKLNKMKPGEKSAQLTKLTEEFTHLKNSTELSYQYPKRLKALDAAIRFLQLPKKK